MNNVELTVRSSGPDETRQVASLLAELLQVGDLVILTGDLGAGKTCFTQGIGRGLGVAEQITSPTFTLASQYQGAILLHHLDAYRLDTLGEALDLDLPELLETGVTVVEWGELLAPVLPNDHLLIAIQYLPECRSEDPPENPSGSSDVDASQALNDDLRLLRLTAVGQRWADRFPIVATKLTDNGLMSNAPSGMKQGGQGTDLSIEVTE